MKAQWKGNNNEGEEGQKFDEDFGNTLKHYKVDANRGKVSQNKHDIDPQQGYH